MGGDFAPAEVLKGIQQYLSESNGACSFDWR